MAGPERAARPQVMYLRVGEVERVVDLVDALGPLGAGEAVGVARVGVAGDALGLGGSDEVNALDGTPDGGGAPRY